MTNAPVLIGGIQVSQATIGRLRLHQSQLVRWNQSINLVARSTLADAWVRHTEDCAQLLPLAPVQPKHWADLGSGGGFPGLVVAIVLAETSPRSRVTMVESDRRKAAFLRETTRLLGLGATTVAERIEEVPALDADVVSARALAPLSRLVPLAARHLGPGGMALFLKGANGEKELASAEATWSFTAERFSSRTDSAAEIWRLKDLNHV